jgi:hypothetical protein
MMSWPLTVLSLSFVCQVRPQPPERDCLARFQPIDQLGKVVDACEMRAARPPAHHHACRTVGLDRAVPVQADALRKRAAGLGEDGDFDWRVGVPAIVRLQHRSNSSTGARARGAVLRAQVAEHSGRLLAEAVMVRFRPNFARGGNLRWDEEITTFQTSTHPFGSAKLRDRKSDRRQPRNWRRFAFR